MHVRNAPCERVVDRDHGQIRGPALTRRKRIFERVARNRLHAWKNLAARNVGIGAVRPLERDFLL